MPYVEKMEAPAISHMIVGRRGYQHISFLQHHVRIPLKLPSLISRLPFTIPTGETTGTTLSSRH